ncbi:LysR family transcriptional regulator [Aureimonas endophytica]|uniref:LysR family transcriptional regulator n=1 Tax=Aureimonas endophytica TaxID=2027858 RepID=A0A917E4J1_9HYPH|nr:LysR family transcriptional regulator [Aureimonas endophytica]GGE02892.1 LysR family transcriptional regulator [Aureimonas endophytica]
MQREELGDLLAFISVASERNFTRAAAKLGVSQSALSQAMRRLETRHGIRLLTRSTRSVSPTEAGEALLETLGPAFDAISDGLSALGNLRDRPAGNFRITAGQHAIETVLWPKLSAVLHEYPDIRVEFSSDNSLTDIVADRFDAGVRLGEQVAKDMIAVRIGPSLRMLVVGAPSYFAGRAAPTTPQDLTNHVCLNIRLPTYGGLYAWEFERDGREMRVRVDGQFTFNSSNQVLTAALDGYGLAFVMEDMVRDHLDSGKLVQVLDDWCAPFAGYHLYYPSRRQPSSGFSLIVEALRHRA